MGVENSSIRAEGKSELYQSACDEKESLPYPLGRPLYLLLCSLAKSTKVLYNPHKRYKSMEKLMTVDDVAEYLRLNREVVLRKARKGEIPAVRVGTKTYRFYKEQVDEWLKSKSVTEVETNKERQLAVLTEARKLQAEIESRVGGPLPNSAEEIRVLREERARRAS